jgi:hypothetical protein
MEQSGEMSIAIDQRNVRPRFEGPEQEAPDKKQIDYAMPAISVRDPPPGGQHRKGSPSVSLPLMPPRNAGPNSDSLKPPHQAIVPPRADQEPTPTLMDVNPESGSIMGGARIWLKGKDFPAHTPLFARFGTAVVTTVGPMEIFTFRALSN